MTFMQRTVELNSQGIQCLTSTTHQAQTRHGSAMSCFKSALTILSSASGDGPAVKADSMIPHRTGAQPLRITLRKSTPIAFAQGPTPTHRHAFYMTCEETEESYEACSAESAIVLYNLALGLHHKGTILGSEVCLHRASLLYHHCIDLLSAIGHCFPSAEAVTVDALKNLADVYAKIGNDSGFRCVLDALLLLNVRHIISHQVVDEDESLASAA